MSMSVAICHECQHVMVYLPASNGLPSACAKCGVPHNVQLNQQQREQINQQQQFRQQNGPQIFNIRF